MIGTLVQQVYPNYLVKNAGFSATLEGTYVPVLAPTSAQNQFTLSAENIAITVT